MSTISSKRVALLSALLLAVSAVALSGVGVAGHNDSDDDGPSDASHYGRCTAYENNENGRENGNAGNATAFQDLEDDAEENDQSVEEFCSEVSHPSENHPPDGAGSSGGQGGGA